MIQYTKDRITETSTWVGMVTLIAYVVMYFTPDNVDALIMKGVELIGGGAILGGAGINIFRKE